MATKDQNAMKASKELARFNRIRSRQKDYKWGPKYQAGTRAVRGESPKISVASRLPAAKLQRYVHALSVPEAFCFALALYNPAVWELHEQHILHPGVRQHPLSAHPKYSHKEWPTTTGTHRIAKRLGVEHPSVWVPNDDLRNPHHASIDELLTPQPSGKRQPIPYEGDGLLFLRDSQGEYLLSWDVKSAKGNHGNPGGSMFEQMRPNARQKADAREAIYREYMGELGIRIVRISLDDIPESVRKNVLFLCLAHSQPVDLPDPMVADLLGEFEYGIAKEKIPLHTINHYVKTDAEFRCAKNLLQIAAWERKLRVNLNYAVLVNEPLVPEESDLLIELAHLFER